jgi:group I intron endonuclease
MAVNVNGINYYGVVYRITNKLNGKCYIGKTVNSTRFSVHISKAIKTGVKTLIGNAIRKNGADAFIYEIIEPCNSDKELNEREIFYIDFYKTFHSDGGYNLTKGGDGGHKRFVSIETRLKIIAANTGRPCAPETKKKISDAQKGRKLSPEHAAALKAGILRAGNKVTPERRRKQSLAMKGRPKSPEHIKKAADAKRGKKLSIEHRNNSTEGKRRYWYENKRRSIVAVGADNNKIIFEEVSIAAIQVGVSRSSIYRCLRGEAKKTGGMTWSYVNPLTHIIPHNLKRGE